MTSFPTGAYILGGEPLAIGPPTGRAEDHAHGLARRSRREQVANDGTPFVEGDPYRIEGLDILDDPVTRRLLVPFRREGSEHVVPHHEHAGIVAVQVAGIRRMMDAMIRGRVEQIFEPGGHAVDDFGMDPE